MTIDTIVAGLAATLDCREFIRLNELFEIFFRRVSGNPSSISYLPCIFWLANRHRNLSNTVDFLRMIGCSCLAHAYSIPPHYEC